MPLHLNLYHEVHKQQAIQRRDPLKIAVLGLAVVAIGLAGYYLIQLGGYQSVKSELQGMEAEYAKLAPKAKKAKEREEEMTKTLKVSETLVDRMEKRFYWAPILAGIAQVVPPEVQLTKFSGDVSNDEKRRCTLTIEGIAAGGDARKTAEDLRRSLAEHFSTKYQSVSSVFRALEDAPETVKIGGEKLPTATFGINVVMEAGATLADQSDTARTAQK